VTAHCGKKVTRWKVAVQYQPGALEFFIVIATFKVPYSETHKVPLSITSQVITSDRNALLPIRWMTKVS
jgi:hypothetical protein